jgi:hypothetical protein
MNVNAQKQTVNPIRSFLAKDNFNKFKAKTMEEYSARLKKMSMWDLSEEAVRIGLSPSQSDRDRITRQLVENFRKAKQTYDIAIGEYDGMKTQVKEPTEAVKQMLDFIRH